MMLSVRRLRGSRAGMREVSRGALIKGGHMPRRKQLKPIPRFRSKAEERAFWESHDTVDFVD